MTMTKMLKMISILFMKKDRNDNSQRKKTEITAKENDVAYIHDKDRNDNSQKKK